MYPCDRCYEGDCDRCSYGNPCLGCKDYDEINDECTSHGACGGSNDEC